jgi:glycosyltransferase involved in cell wall biosynthesis
MRILFFSRDYTTHDRRFLERIAAAGHDVHFLRLEDDLVPYEARPLPDGVAQVDWAGGRRPLEGLEPMVRLLPDLSRVLDEVRPDIVHAGPVQTCALLVALLGFHPLMTMSWGSDMLVTADADGWNRWATAFTLSRTDVFVGDCAPVVDRARAIRPFSDEQVVVFPWGVRLDDYEPAPMFRRQVRERLGWDDNYVVIATRAWLPGYGIERVVRAFAAAHAQEEGMRLLLLGSGPVENEIIGLTERLGVGEAIHRPGHLSEAEVRSYMAVADAYISCNPSDGSSISLLEAMAMRLPVIVTDNEGNRAWVRQGESGFLVDGDAEGFAGALVGLAADPALAAKMGEVGRRIVVEGADFERNVGLLMAAYERFDRHGSRATHGEPQVRQETREQQ